MSKFTLSAFSDEICPDLDGQMNELEKYGIRFIEMRGVDGKNVSDLTLAEAADIRRRMEARGFALSAVGSPIGKYPIGEPFQPQFDYFKHTVELARALGTANIRLFSFFLPAGDDPAAHREEVLRRMRAFAGYAGQASVTLLHENEKQIYGDTAARCRDLLDAVNSPALWMTYDPSNFVQCGESNYPYAYQLLRDKIRYMHMKDSVRVTGRAAADRGFDTAVVSDAHRPVGQGDGDCRAILQALWDSGYEGFLSIEPHLSNNAAIPGTGADKFAAAARALIAMVAEVTGA